MDDQEFQQRCDEALTALYKALLSAADQYGFEVDQNAGAITIEFDDPPAKFVISPNSPVRQIWISALVRSFKLGWAPHQNAFVLPDSGATLNELMGELVGRQLGEDVRL
ncbi:MAG: iron donor protein CyaY [Bryobacterales bacterium]|nr:iron donor protein CyaY [Bryobacterales bacterium]